jgi:DNA repair exonuclease SbcCD ATPase subunit
MEGRAMSDTPRTDAAVIRDKMILSEVGPLEIVDAGTSRQLERELTEARAERDALLAALKLKEEQFDALIESRRNVAQDRKDAVDRAEKAEAECERLRSALRQLADNKLSDENCASVEVAGRRVANIARDALGAARKP